MSRQNPPVLDPAADAGLLLRRIGFATLTLAVPVAALVSRRAAVVLAPIGVALLLLAMLIDRSGPGIARGLRSALLVPAGLCTLLAFCWAALSLAWTEFPVSAFEKLLNLALAAGLALVGVAALPERMRSANLYLMTLGAGGAVLLAVGLLLSGALDVSPADVEGGSFERGMIILALFIWPAIGWLVSRGRRVEALLLAALGLSVALLGPSQGIAGALFVGGIAFGVATLEPVRGPRWIAHLCAAAVVSAPLLPFALRPLFKAVFGALDPYALAARVWTEVVRLEPERLVTGHGLDTAFRGRFSGVLPPESPTSALFEVWYDLGMVGALALAAALWFALVRIGRNDGPLAATKIGAIVTAFSLAAIGLAVSQVWWTTALGIVALAFVAGDRGQFRTKRPKARMWQVANDR